MKKKTEEGDGIFQHPGDTTVLVSHEKEVATFISTYHTDEMRVSFGKDIIKPTDVCDLRTSIWEVPISKMVQCSCMRWNRGNV